MATFIERRTDRGFQLIARGTTRCRSIRVVQQSSAAREDCLDDPGSSCLWVGEDVHLDRVEVAKFRDYLTHWLKTGRLFDDDGDDDDESKR